MADLKPIQEKIAALRAESLERKTVPVSGTGPVVTRDGQRLLNFSSNDYLGLCRHPHVIESAGLALEKYGAGSTASRLICGTLPIHEELEHRLAAFKGYPAALVFGSGYLTNAALCGILDSASDTILADRLAHASLLDGAKSSPARLHRFRHNDTIHLRELLGQRKPGGHMMVATESVFSMDGDLAPVAEIASIGQEHDAWVLIDEAHSTGIFGPHGAGMVSAANLQGQVDLAMGTLSKALGSYGGFVACAKEVRDWLVQSARSLIYTTAPPPVAMGAALGALDVLQREPDLGKTLLRRAAEFREKLRDAGFNTLDSACHIIPILTGTNEAAVRFAAELQTAGVFVTPIRPPTVPRGKARLRISLTLAHTDAHLEKALSAIGKAGARCGVLR